MNVKYLKNPETKEKFYPITQSDCIIDSFSINDLEIDRLFLNSLSVSKHLRGMSYLNLQGLIHYHSKIKDCINEIKDSITDIPEVLIYTAGENITIENNVISAVVPEVDLSGYATEAYVDLEIANIDIPSLDGYATELWVDDNYVKKLYVDLGLPSGLLWATCNVGAEYPEDYGDYFAWGETTPKDIYKWSTYTLCEGYSKLTKYNTSSSYGTVDNKTILELSDDAAHVNWGGNWRMPTIAEWTELLEQCTWTWRNHNGVNGCKVTSKSNGNSIFLPAADLRTDGSLGYAGGCFYWSSSLNPNGPNYALCGFFTSVVFGMNTGDRYKGYSIRPVCEPSPKLDNTKTKEEVVNSTDGVYYFTTDTKEIYRNGESYGGTSLEGYATEEWVEEQGYIKSIPPHTVTINFYNDIDYAVWHNMVGDIEITSMQSTNVLNLYVSDGNNLNEQDVESALDNGPISITNGSTLTFDVIKTTDANGFAAVTLTYNIK